MPSIRPVVPSAGRARDEPPEARRSVLRREVSAEGEADATSARANAEAMTSARRREGIETGVVSRGDSARARRSVSRGGVVERSWWPFRFDDADEISADFPKRFG
jgi:hypothetical protein